MPLNNKGFTLIEVLVSVVILFLSILSVSFTFKEYIYYKNRQQKNEDLYISVISLVNKLEGEDLNKIVFKEGKINSFHYVLKIDKIDSARKWSYGFGSSGNKGKFLISLYKIVIEIGGKKFTLYKTRFKSL